MSNPEGGEQAGGKAGDKSGLRVVVAALAVNVAIAAFKFVAAFLSRSSAMLARSVIWSMIFCCCGVGLLGSREYIAKVPSKIIDLTWNRRRFIPKSQIDRQIRKHADVVLCIPAKDTLAKSTLWKGGAHRGYLAPGEEHIGEKFLRAQVQEDTAHPEHHHQDREPETGVPGDGPGLSAPKGQRVPSRSRCSSKWPGAAKRRQLRRSTSTKTRL